MTSFLAPEVVQTSMMDCGPASLKCLLEGFGVHASYGRLREACQTDVDGTSIDTIEDIAVRLGLDAEQIMIPVDHLLLPEAAALPALVVTRLPNGFTHFVVVWRSHGPWIQIMDPQSGRRFWRRRDLLERLYVHETDVPEEVFGEWMEGDEFIGALERRLRDIGCSDRALLADARSNGWRSLSRLDAGTRMLAALIRNGALTAGSAATRMLSASIADEEGIPPTYFTGRIVPGATPGQVRMRGAVLLRVSGASGVLEKRAALPRDLARALDEPAARPLLSVYRFVRAAGWLSPAVLLIATVLAGVGALVEAVVFRAALDLPRDLVTVQQRLGGALALITLLAAVRALDGPIAVGTLRLGRQVEMRLRTAFLEKIPRLADRYFHSRPISDMAERAHALHGVRGLPELASGLVRSFTELLATTLAIAWLDPASAPLAALACIIVIAVPLTFQPVLLERDLLVRTHAGALARLTLDALLGLMPVRSHGAEQALRREQESLLVEWMRASRGLVNAAAFSAVLQYATVTAVVVIMVVRYVLRVDDTSGVLLLVYWGLSLPSLSEEISTALRQYPSQRNVTLRLLEPLGALEEDESQDAAPGRPGNGAARVEMRGVGVLAGGHRVLSGIDLLIEPGQQVAVIGPSGAGKSSLAGLLLGWHRASTGELLVDGMPLDRAHLDRLRQDIAWVDPQIQIWNRTLLENLRYGTGSDAGDLLARVLEVSEADGLLDRLPDGLQTSLGEGGALVSGGEGQRVRLGRAMMRNHARLVVLDEPFRGLQRDRRTMLLERARAWWKSATLICITHDVSETLHFERVLVMENGRVVEDGAPSELAANKASRYRAMLDAEHAVLDSLWKGGEWRRIRMEDGHLSEVSGEEAPPAVGDRP